MSKVLTIVDRAIQLVQLEYPDIKTLEQIRHKDTHYRVADLYRFYLHAIEDAVKSEREKIASLEQDKINLKEHWWEAEEWAKKFEKQRDKCAVAMLEFAKQLDIAQCLDPEEAHGDISNVRDGLFEIAREYLDKD